MIAFESEFNFQVVDRKQNVSEVDEVGFDDENFFVHRDRVQNRNDMAEFAGCGDGDHLSSWQIPGIEVATGTTVGFGFVFSADRFGEKLFEGEIFELLYHIGLRNSFRRESGDLIGVGHRSLCI